MRGKETFALDDSPEWIRGSVSFGVSFRRSVSFVSPIPEAGRSTGCWSAGKFIIISAEDGVSGLRGGGAIW